MDNTISKLGPGTVLSDRYEIKSLIAKGGMSTVYLAYDKKLRIDLALKVMFPHLLDDKKFVHRFIQEARNAAVLDNPHVVKTLNQGRSGPFMYLTMEYLDGYTLRDILYQEDHFTPRQTLEALEPILSGVAAAHDEKIIHRDLKPENVLITEDGRIKLVDFGLARMMDNKTVTGSLLGTVAYMAPEVINEGEANESSDVYSLGVMIYEMLTGVQPFTGDNPMQVAFAHVTEKVPAPSEKAHGIPKELDELVRYCTENNARNRPQHAKVVLAEVQRLLRVIPGEKLDYNFAEPTRKETPAIHYRPHTNVVPPVSTGETELIPDFLRDHNRNRTREIRRQREQQTMVRKQPPENQTVTIQREELPRKQEITPTYQQHHTPTPKTQHTPAPRVQSQELSRKEKRVNKKQIKKTEQKNFKAIQQSYRVQLRPGISLLRVFFSLVFVGALLYGAGYSGWNLAEHSLPNTQIPNVANQTTENAKNQLTAKGFEVKTIEDYNQNVPAGTVVKTVPDASQSAKLSSLVEMYVSKGPAKTKVPNLQNLDATTASKKLTEQNLVLGKTLKEYSSTIRAGKVIGTNPAAGAEVNDGASVTIVVSLGPK
ncbi:MAG: protein kinase [Micrococcaceae bacterium]